MLLVNLTAYVSHLDIDDEVTVNTNRKRLIHFGSQTLVHFPRTQKCTVVVQEKRHYYDIEITYYSTSQDPASKQYSVKKN